MEAWTITLLGVPGTALELVRGAFLTDVTALLEALVRAGVLWSWAKVERLAHDCDFFRFSLFSWVTLFW